MIKKLRYLFTLMLLFVASVSWASEITGTIKFGNNGTKINSTTVSGNDDLSNTWTITTVMNETSFTQSTDYSQVGAAKKPATSITFTTTLPNEVNITAFSAKFGGFSGTAGTVTLKVGETPVGTGSLDGTNDVTVSSTSNATGKVLTVTVTDIAKGVKCYYVSYTYDDGSSALNTTTTIDATGIINTDVYTGTAAGKLAATVTTTDGAAIEGATVTWSGDKDEVATIAEDGTVTLVAKGTVNFTATYAGVEDQYAGSSATYAMTVTDSTPFIVEDGVFDFVNAAPAGEDYDSGVSPTADGTHYEAEASTWTAGNVTLVASGEYRWWSNDGTLRFKKNGSDTGITISVPDGKVITKIVFTGGLQWETTVGTYASGTWTGSANSVSFTQVSDQANNVKTITVTYEEGTVISVTPPTFSPAAGEVVSGTEVIITAPEGCIVAYTIDGTTDPKEDLENAIRTEGNFAKIEITEAVTIKAVSVDSEENTSDVVEATYTIKQETPQYETVALDYSVNFKQGKDKFVIEDVSLSTGLNYVWSQNSSYGMKASAYVSGTNHASESWLISPLFDLTNVDGDVFMSFEHAINKFASVDKAKEEATVWARSEGGDWQKLDVTYPASLSWNFINSGDINLNAFRGGKVQIGFKYISTTAGAGTWEIGSFNIQKGATVIEYTDETIESLNGKTGASIDNVNLKLNNALVVYVDATQGAYVREGDYAIQFYKTGLELTAGQTLTGDIKFDYSPYKGLPEVKDIADVTTLDEVTVGTASVEPVVTTLAELAELTHVADLVKVENVTLSVDEDKYYMNVGEAQVQLFDKFGTDVIPTEIDETKVYNVTGVFGAIYSGAPEVFPTAIEEVAAETVEVEIKAAATDGKGNYYSTLYYGDKNLVVPEGIEAYTYSVANGNIEESWVYSEGEVIPAATGVVLKTTTARKYNFEVTTATGDEDPDNALLGTDGATTTTAPEGSTGDYKFYALSLDGNNTAGSIGFYYRKGCTNGEAFTNGAHKAYLAVPAGVAAKGYPFGGDETGINDINVNDNINANDAIYSISGQRLQKLQRGINIVNGKKIVVK